MGIKLAKLTVTGNRHIPTVQFGNCDIGATAEIEIEGDYDLIEVVEYATRTINTSIEHQKIELNKCVKGDFEVRI